MARVLRRLLPFLTILACLLPFLPGLGGPFLHDDAVNLGALKVGPFSLQSALDAAFRNESGLLRRPLSNLSLAANIWLGGRDQPFGFKLANLVLHGACGLALFGFARALLLGLWPKVPKERRYAVALLGAALWTLHPLQVSTVLYVVQRMAQWPTLFLLLLAWRFQAWLNRGDFSPRANFAMLAAWGLFALLALASKENGALAPLLTGVLWLLHRARNPDREPPRWVAWILIGLPLLAAAAIAASHPGFVLAGYAGRDFTMPERVLTEAVVLWHYLRLWFMPWIPWMGLYADIPVRGLADFAGWFALAAWALAAATTWALRRRWPLAAFAVLWFLAAHALESTIIPLELVYEHRNYLALPGVAIASAAAIVALAARTGIRLAVLAPLLMLPLAGATLHRAHTWSSPDMFAVTEFSHHPSSNRASMALLARDVAVGDAAGTARLLGHIRALNPGAAWVIALDAALQCDAPRYPVSWDALERMIRRQGTDNRTMQLLRQVSVNRIRARCPYLQADRFERVMTLGFRRSLAEGNRQQAEIYGTYLAWLARSSGDEDRAAHWFRRASAAAPTAVEPLFDWAYMELNRDNPDAV
ncbi:MAG TPA: hypothetical protein VFG18_00145, partial [Xanthomonadaceae bacterium]|nr:hypothetical protein [Xanthomonadaceae bacterium]